MRHAAAAAPVILSLAVLSWDAVAGRFTTFRRVFDAGDLDRDLAGAARDGESDVVDVLLRRGARIGAQSTRGWTPLHIAAREGHAEVVTLLIARGADVSEANDDGETPLHRAAIMGRADVIALLAGKCADVNAKNKAGQTPLCYAALHGWQRVTEALIENGADVNAGPALHVAADKGEDSVARVLLENGADVNAKDPNGRTPLDLAKDEKTRTLLLKYGGAAGAAKQ